MSSLQFFIYLQDQTRQTDNDELGPVRVEIYERRIDGSDVLLQVRVEGGVYAASLQIPGATQLFNGEAPLANMSGADGGLGVLVAQWKPWAEVWTEYHPVVGGPPDQQQRVRMRIEVQRPMPPPGNFDFQIVIKRNINGTDREIGRSELFRNCRDDLTDLSPISAESIIWIGVPSVGQERLPAAISASTDVEYERVRSETADVLSDEGVTLTGLSETAIEEIAAQSVTGLDVIGMPPDPPAKKLYNPDSDTMGDLKTHGIRLALEANVQQRRIGAEQAARDRAALVAALYAGFNCQQRTADPATAGRFHWWPPLDPANWIPADSNTIVNVEVTGIPAATLLVPAAYFYAVSKDLDAATPPLERYNLAAGNTEASLRTKFRQAQIRKLIGPTHAPITSSAATESASLSHRLAARRLRGLPLLDLDGRPEPVTDGQAVKLAYADCPALFDDWLSADKPEDEYWRDFMVSAPAAAQAQHFHLVRRFVCAGISKPLLAAGPATLSFATHLETDVDFAGVTSVGGLKAKSEDDWQKAFGRYWGTDVGELTAREQWQNLLLRLRRYLATPPASAATVPQAATFSFTGRAASTSGLQDFFDANTTFSFDPPTTVTSIKALSHTDEAVIRQLLDLYFLYHAAGGGNDRLLKMEALYFRGFTDPWPVARLTADQFKAALLGTLAYADAANIYANAVALTSEYPEPQDDRDDGGAVARVFRPVNHDGLLTDCMPAEHLAPFGPAAYARALLDAKRDSTAPSLGVEIAGRRGDLGELDVTAANTFTPVLAIDVVNEALESLVGLAEPDIDAHPNSELPPGAAPSIFQTSAGVTADGLAAVPEHSTPSSPDGTPALAQQAAAYDRLREDFSSFDRPYHQPLDVTRSYLEHIGSRRYDTMRAFRKDIHEFVKQPQDMTNAKAFAPYLPPDFDSQTHLRRYPVRIDTAREYLKLSEEEHREVFTESLRNSRQKLWQFWSYPSATGTGHNDTPKWADWLDTHQVVMLPDPNARPAGVRRLSEFLQRSGLGYREFRDLVACGFVTIAVSPGLPEAEPCDIGDYTIDFAPLNADVALERLAVFLRLWRLLRKLPHTDYSFEGIIQRLRRARDQMLNWDGVQASIAAIESAVRDFIAVFESAGATPVDMAHRETDRDAVRSAFAALPNEYAHLAAADASFAALKTRLGRLADSANAQATDEIRALARRIVASLPASDVARKSIESIKSQAQWLAGGIFGGEVRNALTQRVRELRVSLADLSDSLDSLSHLSTSLTTLDGLLPASSAAPVIRNAKEQLTAVLPYLTAVPNVQAAAIATAHNLDAAVAGWWPQTTNVGNDVIQDKLNALATALNGQFGRLSLFPAASTRVGTFVKELHRLAPDQLNTDAVDKCEALLAAFNADRLQDEIRDTVAPISLKIDSLPGTFTDAAGARDQRQDLIDLIDAEPRDGSFATPLDRVDDLLGWWERLAAKDHSFQALKQICDVLGLYNGANINADFIRQLAAMQMLRDDYALCLIDVLPLWLQAPGGVDTPRTEQAKKDLAAVIQERANCLRKEPKKRILHAEEFNEIADLTSLRADAGNDYYPAFRQPTHTLRFVEVCFKVAHSDFSVAELSFLYLNRHLTAFEDDPFDVEEDEDEIKKHPFADKLSSCTDASMLRLQRLLRGAAYGSILPSLPDGRHTDGKPTWDKNTGERKVLGDKFKFAEADLKRLDRVFAPDRQPAALWPPGSGGLIELWGKLETELKALGYADLDALKSLLTEDKPKFTSDLLETAVTRYTQKPGQPKKYDFSAILAFDPSTNKLSCTGLLDPIDILTEVTRLRKTDTTDTTTFPPCSPGEVTAIRDLFEQPRRMLAKFSLILPDQREAARRLLRPKKAIERMKVFVRYFFIFYRQYLVVADHLAAHVLQREPDKNSNTELDNLSVTARYLLLRHIEADENWKDNSGAFQYPNNPNAKAIAGILGLRGTGIWTTFSSFKSAGAYTDVFNQRFDKYVAQVPGAPGLPNANYGRLQAPPPPFPVFPPVAGLPARTALMREISGSLNYLNHPNDKYGDQVGPNSNDWLYNVPKPLRVPEPVDHVFLSPVPPGQQQVELRSGYQLRIDPADKARYGGSVPYHIEWTGRLQVTTEGEHRFVTSFKLPDGEEGPFGTTTIPNLTDDGMRLEIMGAAYTKEIVAAHEPGGASDSLALFGNDKDGAFHTTPVVANLGPGHYDIKLSFVDYSVDPSIFEISKGPSGSKDRHVAWIGVFVNSVEASPLHGLEDIAVARSFPKTPPGGGNTDPVEFFEVIAQSLFIEVKETQDFPGYMGAAPAPFFYPEPYYFSSIRDIRRSYQRAFKALLFCHRFRLVRDEVAFLLSKGADFRGIAHTRATATGKWESRTLNFDFNKWSVGDAFRPRPEGEDVRQYPEAHMPDRVWPLFDQWERFHDYVQIRSDVSGVATPLWQLFHDADDPATPPTAEQLVCNHLGLKASVAPDALLYTTDASPDFPALEKAALKTEEWPIRVWQATQWQYARQRRFAAARGVAPVKYREWARLQPNVPALREYISDAYLENGPVRRYANLAQLNAPLRERGRAALVGYLTSLNRCAMPRMNGGPPFARSAPDLSERLLLDVETGTCLATPRIEEACAAFLTPVPRLRRGLEAISPDDISRDFLEAWDLRLAEYRRWEAWQYRGAYPENYREAHLIEAAARTETFKFLEQQLQPSSLTVDQDWEDLGPPLMPAIPGLIRWIDRLPSATEALPTRPQGYDKLTRRERSLSRTALSPPEVTNSVVQREANAMRMLSDAPLELDGRFIRLQCSTTNRQDDFYFWLIDGSAYERAAQDAGWDWERPYDNNDHLAGIPTNLLAWNTRKTVRLAWCRIRDGIAEDVRVSDYGIPLEATNSELKLDKRDLDLLVFEVHGAAKADQRFVYHPSENIVRVLTSWSAGTAPHTGGLPSFPHFIATAPGTAAGPATFHAPVLLVQKHLRLLNRGDTAREWLEFLHKPLARSNGWLDPEGLAGRPNARVMVLNWLENILDIGESQRAGQRLSTSELARETFALARKVLGDRPRRIRHHGPNTAVKLRLFAPEKPPLNRRLALIWDRTDRLATAIQNYENSHQIRDDSTQSALSQSPTAIPAYGDPRLHDGWMWRSTYESTEPDRDESLVAPPHYRFNVVLQKALELCAETRSFGAALMSAFERGDAEELSLLRSRHEVQINRLLLDVRRSQWREADWQLQALQKAREILETRKQHIEHLIQVGYISDETSYFAHMQVAKALTLATEGFEISAQILLQVPEVYVGVCSMVKFVSGQKYAAGSKIGASLLHMLASTNSMDASMDSMRGSFARREEEWRHQVKVLKIELEQVDRQILAADRRQDIALRELNIHQDIILNAQEVQRFQQGKFTNAEHYYWLQDKLAGLYREMFDVALAAAQDAENAFRYERHYAASDFLASVSWSNYREGMTAGEHLLMALRRMEQANLQQNAREYELGKSVSLRLSAPEALVSLRLMGTCEVDLPEWIMDLEMPGHYRRRVKNVALSVLCAAGPYQTVNAKLTLLSDAVRLSPQVDPHYPEQVGLAGDSRFVRRYAAHQSIVTTSAQNDTGLFETNLRDERYLPFEGAGMISRWRIELDPTTSQFDPDSLTDVVLHFRYTAVDGGAEMREQARRAARQNLPAAGNPATRYLDIQHDFPAQWTNLRESNATRLSVQVDRDMFPWSRNNENVVVEELDLYFKPATGTKLPPTLEIRANGQPCEAALIDQAYGPVYHGRVSLSPAVVQAGTASASVELEIAAPADTAVPQPEVLLVSLKYFFAIPQAVAAPCERFAPLN